MVIIIYRGFGLAIVVGSGIISALIMNFIARGLFDRRYYSEHLWPKFGALWLAGLICLGLGVYFRNRVPHADNLGWYEMEAQHHLFFIPVTIWGILYFIFGVIYLLVYWPR